MRVEHIFFMTLNLRALVPGSSFFSFDIGAVIIKKPALSGKFKNKLFVLKGIIVPHGQRQFDVSVTAGFRIDQVTGKFSEHLVRKNIRMQKRQHQHFKIIFPFPAVGLYPFVLPEGEQMCKFMYQGKQKPVSIQVIVNGDLNLSICKPFKITVFGAPFVYDF